MHHPTIRYLLRVLDGVVVDTPLPPGAGHHAWIATLDIDPYSPDGWHRTYWTAHPFGWGVPDVDVGTVVEFGLARHVTGRPPCSDARLYGWIAEHTDWWLIIDTTPDPVHAVAAAQLVEA